MSTPLPPVKANPPADDTGTSSSAMADDKDDVMTGFQDAAPEEGEVAQRRGDRAVNMDYEVADEEGW